jgi:hypothetical protein
MVKIIVVNDERIMTHLPKLKHRVSLPLIIAIPTEEQWQKEYDRLDKEKENHRIEFAMTRKCKCKNNICRHYKTEKNRLFGRRINNLLIKGLLCSAYNYDKVMGTNTLELGFKKKEGHSSQS